MNNNSAISTQTIKANPAQQWTKIIKPKTSLFQLHLGELWRYRDLVMMFVTRDFVTNFKQTILGPVWFFLQPLITTLTYVIIFGRIARLAPDGLPMILFYLSGITIWNFFSETLNRTATVFGDNEHLFGKVYFPRLTMPLSIVLSKMLRFLIQFLLFIIILAYYYFYSNNVKPNLLILLTPLLLLIMGMLALGLGMIISAMTNKYKDLSYLLSFGVQLLMFATPVIYSLNDPKVQESRFKWIITANPMSSIVETFRYAYLGSGSFNPVYLAYSFICALVILLIGIIIFNRAEKTFTDFI